MEAAAGLAVLENSRNNSSKRQTNRPLGLSVRGAYLEVGKRSPVCIQSPTCTHFFRGYFVLPLFFHIQKGEEAGEVPLSLNAPVERAVWTGLCCSDCQSRATVDALVGRSVGWTGEIIPPSVHQSVSKDTGTGIAVAPTFSVA